MCYKTFLFAEINTILKDILRITDTIINITINNALPTRVEIGNYVECSKI